MPPIPNLGDLTAKRPTVPHRSWTVTNGIFSDIDRTVVRPGGGHH